MEHLNQVQRAVDYIEEHLEEDISVDAIAAVACFSRWHFQMIFSSAVGETLKDYIRKRRLSNALITLGAGDERILDIALNARFESQESFTRAFKNMFGINPGECRKLGPEHFMILNKPKITMDYLDHLYQGINMQPVFKTKSEFHVIGLGASFISILSPEKNNHLVIPKLWSQFTQRQSEIKSRISPYDYGICMPMTKDLKKSHPDECYYMACTEISDSNMTVPEGMNLKTIPAGEYAVFTHKGSLSKLDHTMNYIYGAWLSKSDRTLREAPDLELYDERFKPDSDDSEFDIYIPVVAKGINEKLSR